jgi:hypothetical protein
MTSLGFLLILKYCLVSGLFAVAMFCSAQIARFLSIAALGTAFLAAGVGRNFLTGSVVADCAILVGTAALVGLGTAVAAAVLHEVAGVDRVTAGVITYFLAYGTGLVLADGGMAKLPQEISPPPVLVADVILIVLLLSCVTVIIFYTGTYRGLRAVAFSQSPDFAGRFGSDGKVVDFVPIYLAPLFFGEFIAGLGGCMSLYLDSSTSRDYAFQPILIGVIAAGVAQFAAWRARIWVRLLITLTIGTLWALIFVMGADLQLPRWAADMKEGFAAFALAILILSFQLVVKHLPRKPRSA